MKYISYILETNLSISRFMIDHAIILLSIIPHTDNETCRIYEKETKIYSDFLLNLIPFSYNRISDKFTKSEILITNYTILMDNKTFDLYKIEENKIINIECTNLILESKYKNYSFTKEEFYKIQNINALLLKHLYKSLESLEDLKTKLSLAIFSIYFPSDFITHLIDELNIYIYTLDFFDRKMSFTPTYINKCNYYFNVFLKQHAEYIKGMTFPVEYNYLEKLNNCEYNIKNVLNKFDDSMTPSSMENYNIEIKKVNKEFANYNTYLIKSLMYNNYYASAIPLLNDHIIRESNYVGYQLDIFRELAENPLYHF